MDLTYKNHLKKELIAALNVGEFILYYQPQINLMTGKFEGVEALIRWLHPQRGLILPKEFIDYAEESDCIISIGEWVLREACLQNKAWQDKGLTHMRIAVNVSGKQFQQENFVELIAKILAETKMDANYLELELTENIILYHEEKMIKTIQSIKDMGVKIVLDDFGTGYSSISHLKKIPVDKIKIDRVYVQNMHVNNDDAAIVRAIIALATSLNLQVLAEGVETLKQLEMLTSQACPLAQGFYFSEPLSSKEMEKFLIFYQNKPFSK